MRLFISYTRRDGCINNKILQELKYHLHDVFKYIFIHALEDKKKYEQLNVIKELIRSDITLLIISPKSNQSPWVRLELFLSKLLFHPIIKISISDLLYLQDNTLIDLEYKQKDQPH